MIKQARERKAPWMQARPVEIAEHRAAILRRGKMTGDGELVRRVFPCAAVEDKTIHPRPELFIEWLWKIRLPPEAEREIRIKVRENDIRK